MVKKTIRITPQQADIRVATYIFAYYKYHGEMPSLQEVGLKMKFTRQAAYNRFKRFEQFGIIQKIRHGTYQMNSVELMPMAFEGLYKAASKELYIRLYKNKKNKATV